MIKKKSLLNYCGLLGVAAFLSYTAPISWQFGGMDGLREELIPFAEQYVEDKYYSRNEHELATFEQRGKGTLIASGIVKDTKENMYHMLHNTGMTYLKGLGVKDSTLWYLSGSVRKGGNTELLVQAFVDGAKKNNSVEVISVADYKVNPCIGCNTCFDREGHECFQKDDMTKVYEKLKMADVLVIASSVYFYGVSSQLKALIDRLHTPMRNEFKLKKLALILVGAATLPELFNAIKVQYQLVLNYFKLEDAGTVLVRGAKDKGDVKNTDGLERAYQLGITI